MKRKPSEAGDQDAADVLVVGAGRELDPARRGAGGSRRRRARAGAVAHGTSPFSIRLDDAVLGGLDVALLLLDEVFVFLRRDDFDLGPHRRVGLAGEGRRLAVEDAFFVGAEDDLVVLAGDRVALAGEVGHVPGVDDVGRDEVELDRGVDRDDQLVVGEGAVRVVVAPEPLLAGRFDPQRLGLRRPARPSAPVAGVSRALSVKTTPRTKITAAKTVSAPPTRNWMRRPPLTWRGSAPRSPR